MTETTLEKENDVQQETGQILRRFSRKRDYLIPILQKVQERLGYLPREAMQEVAEFLDISEMDVYSVVTFYNQFRLNPPGKHSIRICLGTACHMKGSYIALDAWKRRLGIGPGGTTEDREFDLEVNGIFVAVGIKPNSQTFSQVVTLDEAGFIITDELMRTSAPGIFAAGDVRHNSFRQVITATGDGAAAAMSAFKYVKE
jgi:NADH:ubiquinone oxidoreductase subunit E